ncbi:hypothetical protein DBV05_g8016 [Lasiodiplodia theobromae]|uniref:Uncharacterized protein n=1 Tax=Lasiodiplodia theobromae TaxID=45133 RepID=A0A5N5D6A5_9PEZI|nr:hypothetical protein DBV05_g8016 [Lasiodiplodia theobromae]
MASSVSSGSDSASQNLNALGTLIGYLGAEAATIHLFERILWPQRFWNRLDFKNALLMVLFMPMGGPLHKAALQTLDSFFEHGLLKGGHRGHMLDTAFFQDYKLEYNVWVDGERVDTEQTRNGLWIRAISEVKMEDIPPQKSMKGESSRERPIRAATSFSRLVLDYNTDKRAGDRPVIRNDTGNTSLHVIFGVFLSELTGVAVGTVAAYKWKTGYALLWFLPLILKLISIFAAVAREDLARPSENAEAESEKCFEILHRHGVLMIQGKESVVLQFFRHYGHPIRNRHREVLQFVIIVCLGLVFPAGLVISIIWMPVSMQYLWFSYQLYATLAMHVYRYANGHLWGSTEEAIVAGFDKCRRKEQLPASVVLSGRDGTEVVATIETTYYNNLKDAKQEAARRLAATKQSSIPRSSSDTTLRSEDDLAGEEQGEETQQEEETQQKEEEQEEEEQREEEGKEEEEEREEEGEQEARKEERKPASVSSHREA